MRHGRNRNTFDLPSAHGVRDASGDGGAHDARCGVDGLDEILNIASGVLADYGTTDGSTRIERLARYIVATLGGEPDVPTRRNGPHDVQFSPSDMAAVWTEGPFVGILASGALEPDQARAVTVALVRAIETAEDDVMAG
jgi:hypothetical protein